jgi:ATP-binding cassette subfamily F protein uup
MSSIISTEAVGHAYDDRWLFRNLTTGLQRGEKVALVGSNGAGKSTFLRILAGALLPKEGRVVQERGLRVSYLEQNPDFSSADQIADYIYSTGDIRQDLIRRYEELIDNQNINQTKLDELMSAISEQGAWEYEHLIKTILSRFSISAVSQRIATLSGGQRKRLALTKMLIDEPDVYLLDEPTNHLDIGMIEWLENYLTTGNKTVIMVTHDRYFLDRVCNRIIEVAPDGVFNYNGNYSYFLEKKSERIATQASVQQKNKQLLKKELEWMRRQPQARATKSKARINAYHELETKVKTARAPQKLNLSIKAARQGKTILELTAISKSYHTPVVRNFSYTFKPGDRIGIAGANGSGKSTLLNILTGSLTPDQGQVIRGETTKIGYYKQETHDVDSSARVIDVIKSQAEYLTLADGTMVSASQLLTQFLFPPSRQHVPVGLLSGGERKRLQLMNILIHNPNFLILDEPTNDLDIDTLNVLEDFLEQYTGVLLLVSHDRYLMDRLCDQLFILKDGEVIIYNGNYSDYRLVEENKPAKILSKTPSSSNSVKKEKKSLSYKEERELESLETGIEEEEIKIKSLTESLNTTTDYTALSTIAAEIEQRRISLDKKTDRWVQLSELKEVN